MDLSENYKLRLQQLSGIITEENHKKEYGALMLTVNYKGWDKIMDEFEKSDLYTEEPGFGLETDPHVTILFGFHENVDLDKLQKLIKSSVKDKIIITIKNRTYFESVNDKYDVVKYDIESKDLSKLNKLMIDNFDYTSDFPDYHPHMTTAYVLVGKGEKYKTKQEPISIECTEFVYSPPGKKKKTYFKL